jgi:exodeoxyribonuclease V gamma subunit
VAWALDGEHRARFGVPAIEETTFAWGMDRLLAGYAMGDDAIAQGKAWALPDGPLWPVEGVHGPQAQVLGALDRLLLELAALQRDAGSPRSASAWAARLEQLLDALFRVDPRDGEAAEALSLLRRLIQATAMETADCGLDPPLEFIVVRDVLRDRLAAAPERQRFLLGGVTFCGMVPQRAIPFRVVAVLGLNDGEFPRNPSDAGLDLMARHRRLGDRDVRSDDRYLFLETVMAAREVLHLSYLGEGVRDGKPRNPAAPLAELMQFLDEQAGLRTAAADIDEQPLPAGEPRTIRRPWRIRHPLQPFDARYFDGSDPRLCSFDASFAAMRAADAPATPFLAGADAAEVHADDAPIPLREVQSYFRDPARQLLAQRLHVRLDALDDERLQGRESLQASVSALERVPQKLLFEAIESGRFEVPDDPPAWLCLGGVLPPGRIGLDAWTAERTKVQTLLARAADHPLFAGTLPRRTPVALTEPVADLAIDGALERVWSTGEALWQFEVFPGRDESELGFRERIPFFIEWALLRLRTDAATPVRACVLAEGDAPAWERSFNAWDEAFVAHAGDATACAMRADLAARLCALIELWRRAPREPLGYFPRTSWAALDEHLNKAQQTWAGSHGHPGERDYAPGYTWLLAGAADFSPEQPAFAELQRLAVRLSDLINLNASGLDVSAGIPA